MEEPEQVYVGGNLEDELPPPLNRNKKRNPFFRLEYLMLAILVSFILFKELRSPLEAYVGVELNFKTPAALREYNDYFVTAQKNAMEFEEEDWPLVEFDESHDSHDLESHDSHDVIIQELTPPALKLIEDYTYFHSHHRLLTQAEECMANIANPKGGGQGERRLDDEGEEDSTAKHADSLKEAMQNGKCKSLAERKFLVITFNCDESESDEPVEGLMDFLRSMAWAIVTDRTLLYKPSFEVDTSDCGVEECGELCQGIAVLDPWVPHFDYWNHIYDWFGDSNFMDFKTLNFDENNKIDSPTAPNLVTMEDPPPLNLDFLSSSDNKEKAQELIDWGMSYGMILDESIVMEEPDIDLPSSSDEDEEITKHYSIDATANCPLEMESPCVIFQVGETDVGPSNKEDCRVERVTEGGSDTKRAMFHTLARAGNGWNGASLNMKNPLSQLLLELLQYRGRLERGSKFELQTCLANDLTISDAGRRNLR